MNVVGSNYIPVQANEVMPMAEGGSGQDSGWQQDGSYVNWNSETGVTGKGWDGLIRAEPSPFVSMTGDEIEEHIKQHGNLDQYFKQVADYFPSERSAFYRYLENFYGFTNQSGCIGDKLYP